MIPYTSQNLHDNQWLINRRYGDGMKQMKATTYPLRQSTFVSILLTCICAELWTACIFAVVKMDGRHIAPSTVASVTVLKEAAQFVDLITEKSESKSTEVGLGNNTSMLSVSAETSGNSSHMKNGPKIVWLMSFPNSGTSYTTKLIRSMTQTNTASNYGFEHLRGAMEPSIRVYDDQPNGPFYVDVDLHRHPERTNPKKFVLTKTHCGLHCEDCSPRKYIETTFSFRNGCSYAKWIDLGRSGQPRISVGTYSPSRVVKSVHLIRDPFDNIVSRFHLEQHERQKRQAKTIPYSFDRDGFRSYCKALHHKHFRDEMQYDSLREAITNLTTVPCGTDFLKFTEWHNLAFAITTDMNLDSYILHYDDYETNFNKTIENLLNFLELKAVADPFPFRVGKIYRDYFTPDEERIVRQVVESMSTTSTWKALQRYFVVL